MKNSSSMPRQEADQTVRLEIDTKERTSSIRISFTDQRLTAHGGMALWSHFLHQKAFRKQLREVLPHEPTSPNAYDPTDVGLGYLGGIICGADKLSRVAWLQSDPALSEVLGIEAVPSQSTFSRFFDQFDQKSCHALNRLHQAAVYSLPSLKEGYTLDLDSCSLLHEDGHQEGVKVGHTRRGLKPCLRPLIAALAEPKMVAGYWLRRGDSNCSNGAAEFLRQTVKSMPAHIRIDLVRGDSGFGDSSMYNMAEALGLKFILVWGVSRVGRLCRHADEHWQPTEIAGLEIQEVEHKQPGASADCDSAADIPTARSRRENVIRSSGLSLPSLAHKPSPQCQWVGGMAPLQRSGRRGEPHQRTRGAIWVKEAVRQKVLGHGGDPSSGHCRLQPVRVAAASVGAVGKVRIEHIAVAVVLARGRVEPSPRQTHP